MRRAGRPDACSSRSRTVTRLPIRSSPLLEKQRHRLVQADAARLRQIHEDRRGRDDFGERCEIEGCSSLDRRGPAVERQCPEGIAPGRVRGRADDEARGGEDAPGNRALE